MLWIRVNIDYEILSHFGVSLLLRPEARVLHPGVHSVTNTCRKMQVKRCAASSHQRMLSQGGTPVQTIEIIMAEEVGWKESTRVSAQQTNSSPLLPLCLFGCVTSPYNFPCKIIKQRPTTLIQASPDHVQKQHHPHLSGTYGHPACAN